MACLGNVGIGMAGTVSCGVFGYDRARRDKVGFGRHGRAWRVSAMRGLVR